MQYSILGIHNGVKFELSFKVDTHFNNFPICSHRDHPFSMYAKFSRKLTFLTTFMCVYNVRGHLAGTCAYQGQEMLVLLKICVCTKTVCNF